MGKKIDFDYSPDFNGIEIKCCTRFSKFPLTLFSLAFDGPTDKEIIRINQLYGENDKQFNDKKILIKTLKYNQLSKLDSGYFLGIDYNENDNRLYLCVYNENKELIDKESYILIETMKEHLLKKLRKLAIIKASKKKDNDKEYFRYYELNYYEMKSFDTFLKLLISGNIQICITSRFSRSGINQGKYYNKILVFQIKKSDIEKLFTKKYSYNSDEKKKECKDFIFLTI